MSEPAAVLLGIALTGAMWATGWLFWKTITAVVADLHAAARRRKGKR